MNKKPSKAALKRQINACKEIIESINEKDYYNASILIRFYLNDNNFIWYKNIQYIIEDQISNLFLDIQDDFKKDRVTNFFKNMIDETKWIIDNEC